MCITNLDQPDDVASVCVNARQLKLRQMFDFHVLLNRISTLYHHNPVKLHMYDIIPIILIQIPGMKRSYLRLSHGHTHGRHFAMTHLDPLANHEVAKK